MQFDGKWNSGKLPVFSGELAFAPKIDVIHKSILIINPPRTWKGREDPVKISKFPAEDVTHSLFSYIDYTTGQLLQPKNYRKMQFDRHIFKDAINHIISTWHFSSTFFWENTSLDVVKILNVKETQFAVHIDKNKCGLARAI